MLLIIKICESSQKGMELDFFFFLLFPSIKEYINGHKNSKHFSGELRLVKCFFEWFCANSKRKSYYQAFSIMFEIDQKMKKYLF
jgi:hypothetical protein